MSGPQGHIVPFTIIEDPGTWYASDWSNNIEQLYVHITPEDVAELTIALKTFKESGVPRTHINRDVFPLNHLAKKLEEVETEVRLGRGIVVLRGVPLDLTNEDMDILTMNLGLSCYLGRAAPLTGSLTTQVRRAMIDRAAEDRSDTNAAPDAATPHLLNSLKNILTGYHTDVGGDILSLLCIRKGEVGGISSLCSVFAVHNELIKRGRMDVLKTLLEPEWCWDMSIFHSQGASAFSETNKEERFVRRPILTYNDGFLSCVYTWLLRKEGAEPLTPEQTEALRVVEEIAQSKEFCLQFYLEPGDLSLMNNHTIIHARSHFEDTPENPRHLVRTWIEFDASKNRSLPDHVISLRENNPVLKRPSVNELRSGSSKFLHA